MSTQDQSKPSKPGPIAIPLEIIRKMQEEVREMERRQKAMERQQTEDVELTVGTHESCGGPIIYKSSFRLACRPREVRFGGRNPTEEVMSCSCAQCGQSYDPLFPPYRNQLEAHRNRPIED